MFNNSSLFDPNFLHLFNQERANTVKNTFFKNNPNVEAKSRESVLGIEIPKMLQLTKPGKDPVGISMFLKFDPIPRVKFRKEPVREVYRDVRSL